VKTVVDDSMIFSEEELEAMKDKPMESSNESKASAAVPAGAMAGEASEPTEKVKFNPEKYIMLEDARRIIRI